MIDTESLRRELHARGLSDGDIARVVGRRVSAIQSWRDRRGLQRNFDFGDNSNAVRNVMARTDETLRPYLKSKATSFAIAIETGLCWHTVADWRRRNNVKPPPRKYTRKHPHNTLKEKVGTWFKMYPNATPQEVAAVVDCSPEYVRAWKSRHGKTLMRA